MRNVKYLDRPLNFWLLNCFYLDLLYIIIELHIFFFSKLNFNILMLFLLFEVLEHLRNLLTFIFVLRSWHVYHLDVTWIVSWYLIIIPLHRLTTV